MNTISLRRSVLLAFAVVCVTAAGSALAHGGRGHEGRPGGGPFAQMDSNKDGKVTRAEVQAEANRRFDLMDTDKNGAVTQEEARAAFKAQRGERHGEPDCDQSPKK
jgi:hypothetical protein